MFTGIVQNCFPVVSLQQKQQSSRFSVELSEELISDVKIGASIAVDGVCLTVADQQGNQVFFDVMHETLQLTTLSTLAVGRKVNIERSARFGDEIGGHLVSGHVSGRVKLIDIEQTTENKTMTLQAKPAWMKYILNKGFIALDGASLTICDPDEVAATFKINLIPETLKRTTFGCKQVGDFLNIEFDPQTQAIVDTVAKIMRAQTATT